MANLEEGIIMAYPSYIPTRVVTIGGAMALESSTPLKMSAEIRASRSLVWGATGYRFEASGVTLSSEADGTELSIALPLTDLEGWRDASTGAIIDTSAPNSFSHTYTATVTIGRKAYTYGPFVVPAGDDPIDLDLTVPAATVAGGTVAIPDSWSQSVTDAIARIDERSVGMVTEDEYLSMRVDPDGHLRMTRDNGDIVDVGVVLGPVVTDADIAGFTADPDSQTSAQLSSEYVGRGYDVILLLGQSNMSGRGTPYSLVTDPSNARIFQMKGKGTDKGTVITATEPLDMVDSPTGIGPGLQFARHYLAAGLNGPRDILLVPCAQGGTPLVRTTAPTWNPATVGSLYDNAVSQATAAAALSRSRVVAALWVQGETDGDLSATGSDYLTKLTALIDGVRSAVGVSDLPFIIGQMVPEYLSTGTRREINAAHIAAATIREHVEFVSGPESANRGDGNHYARGGAVRLATDMFEAFANTCAGLPYRPTGVYLDEFTRDDSNDSLGSTDTGQTWAYQSGTFGIVNQQAFCATPVVGNQTEPAALITGPSDCAVQVRLASLGSVHQRIYFRRVDKDNMWLVQRRAGSSYQLYKKVGGTFTQVETTSTVVPVAGDVLRVEMFGDDIRVYVNGALQWAVTDAYNSTATLHGFGTQDASPSALFDSFRMEI